MGKLQIPRYEPMQETNPYRARGYKGERQCVSEMVRQHRTGYTWVSHKVYRMYRFTAIQYYWNLYNRITFPHNHIVNEPSPRGHKHQQARLAVYPTQ